MNESTAPQKDLGEVINQLFENFVSQLQELKKPKEKFSNSTHDYTSKNIWSLYGHILIFDNNLTVTLCKIWEDESGWRVSDPRPDGKQRVEIKIPFVCDDFERKDWDSITDKLEKKIKALPEITYNK